MIIAFHGQKNNGKDTAGEIIQKFALGDAIRLKRVAFADQMKILAAKSLGYDDLDQSYLDYGNEIQFMNSIKDMEIEVPSVYTTPYYPSDLTNVHVGCQFITGREYLINFGESHREVFGEDYWAKIAFAKIAPWPDIVVTDLRLEAEAAYLQERQAHIIYIYREKDMKDGFLPGDQKLDDKYIDYYCDNTGSLQDLEKQLKQIYEDIKSKYEFRTSTQTFRRIAA